MTRRAVPAVLALTLALGAGGAHAASAPAKPWATINICDTGDHADQMGVRASMPGNGKRQRMYMRFQAQFFSSKGKWQNVRGAGRSKWIYAGSARFAERQAGYTFSFTPPRGGGRFVLRGLVAFEWRERRRGRRDRVVRRLRRNTKGGFPLARGGDPPGYSSGVCEIRP